MPSSTLSHRIKSTIARGDAESENAMMAPDGSNGSSTARRTKSSSSSSSSSSRWVEELQEQLPTILPSMFSLILYQIPWILSLRFVGKIGSEELAAAALATTLCNVTGMSLSIGMSSGLVTLTGQTRGELKAQAEKNFPYPNSTRRLEKVQECGRNVALCSDGRNDEEKKDGNDSESIKLLSDGSNRQSHSIHDGYRSISKVQMSGESASVPPLPPLLYLYRGLFVQFAFVIPVGIWWIWGIEEILLSMGQGEKVSSMTADYLRILAPGLWGYSASWPLTCWFQTLDMAIIPACAASIGLALHVPTNLFFIHVLGWGYLGVGAATAFFQVLQPVLMVSYAFGTSLGSRRLLDSMHAREAIGRTSLSFWPEAKLAVSSLSGIIQYLSLALPGVVAISEWWASEISIFLGGMLVPAPDLALGGISIYQCINTFCFMVPMACSVSGSARVGHSLGREDIRGADEAAKVSIGTATILSVLVGLGLYSLPHSLLPSFFTSESGVLKEASSLIPLLSIYVVGDGIQTACNGVVKGCGKQCVVTPIIVVAYWLVGVPLGYYLSFVRHDGVMCGHDDDYGDGGYFCGVKGLVGGLTVGTCVHALLLALVVCTVNWEVESQKAKERLEVDKRQPAYREKN